MKYRKKPVVIDAFKWTADIDQVDDPTWAIEAIREGRITIICGGTPHVTLIIRTLEGEMTAHQGDYIIRGIKGELYPCKPDIFEATYEAVEKGNSANG